MKNNIKVIKKVSIFLSLTGILLVTVIFLGNHKLNILVARDKPIEIQLKYEELPPGSIKPDGWLREQLMGQGSVAKGLTELMPMAYILDDPDLIKMTQKAVKETIESRFNNGSLVAVDNMSEKDKNPGLQNMNILDFGYQMAIMRSLKQYFSVSNDPGVIRFINSYFEYISEFIDQYTIDYSMLNHRDMLEVICWLKNQDSGSDYSDLLTSMMNKMENKMNPFSSDQLEDQNVHDEQDLLSICQDFRSSDILYHIENETVSDLNESIKSKLDLIQKNAGFISGIVGNHEHLIISDSLQRFGVSNALELMNSLETLVKITGDTYYVDFLERIAYNLLPGQFDNQYYSKDYSQYNSDSLYFKYHLPQAWPKFVMNLWYKYKGTGVVAMMYGNSELNYVSDKGLISFKETSDYPFNDKVHFKFTGLYQEPFSLFLRIPGWCRKALVSVNGKDNQFYKGGQIIEIKRFWSNGDELELRMPMEVKIYEWNGNTVGIERGPLLYALNIEDKGNFKRTAEQGMELTDYDPGSDWNYALCTTPIEKGEFVIMENKKKNIFPWKAENSPVCILMKARRVNNRAGNNYATGKIQGTPEISFQEKPQTIKLIPYGCSNYSIAEFPKVKN